MITSAAGFDMVPLFLLLSIPYLVLHCKLCPFEAVLWIQRQCSPLLCHGLLQVLTRNVSPNLDSGRMVGISSHRKQPFSRCSHSEVNVIPLSYLCYLG